MKRTFAIAAVLVVATLLMGSATTYAQDKASTRIGLGVSLFDLSYYLYDYDELAFSNSIFVPIDIKNKLRIEPSFSFVKYEDENYISLDAGLFGIKSIDNYNLLFGARFGIMSEGYSTIAPTVGGEYMFAKKFSIGAEAQLQYINVDSEVIWMTNSSVIIRFYF